MKKYILTLAALLSFSYVAAQKLYTDEVIEIPQGGQVNVAIKYEAENYELKALQFKLDLPTGITVGSNSSGKTFDIIDPNGEDFTVSYNNNGWNAFSATSHFANESGTFMSVVLSADESLSINSTHTVTVKGPMVSRVVDGASEAYYLEDFTFTIKIVDYVLLDEESTAAPTFEAEGVNIKVKRTIKGGRWNTICLPFAMDEDQLQEVFGDVELAEFISYDIEKDEANNIINIEMNFEETYEIEPNTPYLIKVENDITEFSVVSDLEPDEESAYAQSVKTSTTARRDGKFTGLYHKDIVPDKSLFIREQNFYYSTGATVIKGYRGYFTLKHELATLSAGVKVQINVNGTPTQIDDLQIANSIDGIFTIDGKKMNNDVTKLPKGVYIIDGKKVAIK